MTADEKDFMERANDIVYNLVPNELMGEVSDGYHTFNELYHHRALLFASLCNLHPDYFWKSKKHDNGSMYNGMFIVGMNTPEGSATYHYDIDPYWDMFHCTEIPKAPVFDGHSPADAIQRIFNASLVIYQGKE